MRSMVSGWFERDSEDVSAAIDRLNPIRRGSEVYRGRSSLRVETGRS